MHPYYRTVNLPSGQVLMSTVDARFLAWPADVVLTTSNLNPASCRSIKPQVALVSFLLHSIYLYTDKAMQVALNYNGCSIEIKNLSDIQIIIWKNNMLTEIENLT